MTRTTTIERTTLLPRPPTVAFAVVMSPETAPLIDPAVRTWAPDVRPIGVGTRFTIRGRIGLVPIRATSEVVAWTPPQSAEFRSVRPDWPFRMTASHRFIDRDGETDYTWTITFYELNVVARPLIAIAARLFRRAFAAQSEALSRYLERLPAEAPPPAL